MACQKSPCSGKGSKSLRSRPSSIAFAAPHHSAETIARMSLNCPLLDPESLEITATSYVTANEQKRKRVPHQVMLRVLEVCDENLRQAVFPDECRGGCDCGTILGRLLSRSHAADSHEFQGPDSTPLRDLNHVRGRRRLLSPLRRSLAPMVLCCHQGGGEEAVRAPPALSLPVKRSAKALPTDPAPSCANPAAAGVASLTSHTRAPA